MTTARSRSSSPSRSPPDDPAQPSILLVTLDTTRADRVGFEWPAGGDAAPRRARRQRRPLGAQAYTTAPETLPAHASMLTGLYPPEHGMRVNAHPLPAGW